MTDKANAEDQPPTYDVEAALTLLGKNRLRADPLTTELVRLADQLGPIVAQHFAPQDLETAGLAMMLGGAGVPAITSESDLVVAACTVLAYAGEHLVAEARAVGSVRRKPCPHGEWAFCDCNPMTEYEQKAVRAEQLGYCETSVRAGADPEEGEQCSELRVPGYVHCEHHGGGQQ